MVDTADSAADLQALRQLRAGVPGPDTAQLARVETRLHASYVGIIASRPMSRRMLALVLVGTLAAAGGIGVAAAAVRHHPIGPAASQGAATVLAEAARRSSGVSFRVHETIANSTASAEATFDMRGVWDPNGPKAVLQYYDAQGRLDLESRLDGARSWSRLPGHKWVAVGFADAELARAKLLGRAEYGLDRRGTLITAEPGPLLTAYLKHGIRFTDLGVQGDVHRYGFEVQSTPLPSTSGPKVETGTVEVDTASDHVVTFTWTETGLEPEEPFQATVYTTVIRYSDYGVQVNVVHPGPGEITDQPGG
jgi:hypothetical protein